MSHVKNWVQDFKICNKYRNEDRHNIERANWNIKVCPLLAFLWICTALNKSWKERYEFNPIIFRFRANQ
jgi:hypothetical protein